MFRCEVEVSREEPGTLSQAGPSDSLRSELLDQAVGKTRAEGWNQSIQV